MNVATTPAEKPTRKMALPSGNSLGVRWAKIFMESAHGELKAAKLRILNHNNATCDMCVLLCLPIDIR